MKGDTLASGDKTDDILPTDGCTALGDIDQKIRITCDFQAATALFRTV